MGFVSDLKDFTKKAEKAAEKAVEKSFAAAAVIVVDKTKVDSGRTKANWRARTNAVDGTVDSNTDPLGTTTKAAAKINIDIGDVAYFTNSVSHILVLEHGSSKTSAKPMIAPVVANWQNIVDKSIK